MPDTVLTNDAAEAAPAEISKARTLYTQAGTAMIVIYAILDTAYTIVCDWGADTIENDPDDPDAIRLIEKAEETMNAFKVPLPTNEAIQPLLKQEDFPFGKPFDGLRLSYLSKQK